MFRLIRTINENKRLIWTWTYFNIQASYIDTKLGIIWIILQPILHTLIYTFVFSTIIQQRPKDNVPFILFYLAGTTVWQFITTNWMQSGQLIVKHSGLLSQVKVSAEVIVLVQFLQAFVDFIVGFIILFIGALFFGYYPTSAYLFLPVIIFFMMLVTLGGMFFISSLGVFIRDIPSVTSLILRLMFFLSGVIISPDMLSNDFANLLYINPLLHLIDGTRNIMLYSEVPSLRSFIYMGAFSVLVFIIGYNYFCDRQGIFVDYQ